MRRLTPSLIGFSFLMLASLIASGEEFRSITNSNDVTRDQIAEAFAAHEDNSDPATYFDLGNGAYLVTVESVPISSGLFFVVPTQSKIVRLFGPFVEALHIRQLHNGKYFFLFKTEGYGYTRYFAFITKGDQQEPDPSELTTVEWDMVSGKCGDSPHEIEVAGKVSDYSVRINRNGLPEITFHLEETNCRSHRTRTRAMNFHYVADGFHPINPSSHLGKTPHKHDAR